MPPKNKEIGFKFRDITDQSNFDKFDHEVCIPRLSSNLLAIIEIGHKAFTVLCEFIFFNQ